MVVVVVEEELSRDTVVVVVVFQAIKHLPLLVLNNNTVNLNTKPALPLPLLLPCPTTSSNNNNNSVTTRKQLLKLLQLCPLSHLLVSLPLLLLLLYQCWNQTKIRN